MINLIFVKFGPEMARNVTKALRLLLVGYCLNRKMCENCVLARIKPSFSRVGGDLTLISCLIISRCQYLIES